MMEKDGLQNVGLFLKLMWSSEILFHLAYVHFALKLYITDVLLWILPVCTLTLSLMVGIKHQLVYC
jgi:hypothetical protein